MFRAIASVAVLSTILLSSGTVCAEERLTTRETEPDPELDLTRIGSFAISGSPDPYILQFVFLWAGLELPALPTIDTEDPAKGEDQLATRETTVEYELEPVLITSYSLSGTSGEEDAVEWILVWTDTDAPPLAIEVPVEKSIDDGSLPSETLSLNFDKVQWQYWPMDAIPQDIVTLNFSKIETRP